MMLFGQKIHPLNFEYPSGTSAKNGAVEAAGRHCKVKITCAEITPSCTRLRFDNSAVLDKQNYSDGLIEAFRAGKNVAVNAMPPGFKTAGCTIDFSGSGFTVRLASEAVLETATEGFGFNGEQTIFNFKIPEATGFYGFGERTKRLNKNGDNLHFYNIDVCNVYPHTSHRDDYDPSYVAIPFAIIRCGGICTGIFIDNPDRLVFDVGQIAPGHFICQSLAGNNDLYFINGPTLKEVVRQFSKLTGHAELPPVWSLGHHQCRWGYKTAGEFRVLKEKFNAFDLPVSALWFDIDYMDKYRTFTWDRFDIPNPASLNRELNQAGIRAVAIVDPGVKLEAGYKLYESGKRKDVFCKTLSGRDYVGTAWPGDSLFPDYSEPETRNWWAGHLAQFIKESRIDGLWLDMNEPATGWSSAAEMRFAGGALPHGKYHNQYGHFMAKASRQAFENLDKNARPFLLTRSGYTGTQRYSAIWTGDNSSNWDHLSMSIPCTLNLGLSGVAFNGPDVGGFCGHAEEELIIRWYQACFLFPFFRNHTNIHTKEQEPWNFGPECLEIIRNTIYTRYRLIPYLYTCFFEHFLNGDPVLRPLLYEFDDQDFENLDDQFMVGRNLLVAPILAKGTSFKNVVSKGVTRQQRHVTLPPGWWFDLTACNWIEGGRTIPYEASLDAIPLFVRDGAVIPYYNGKFRNSEMPLNKIELHLFIKQQAAEYDYFIDDHETRNYLDGDYNTAHIEAGIAGHDASVRITETGGYTQGSTTFTPVFYGTGATRVLIEINKSSKSRLLKPSTRRWVGVNVPVRA